MSSSRRYYAVVGSIEVILPHDRFRFFDKKKTKLTASEARDFFYHAKGRMVLLDSLDEAKMIAAECAARSGTSYNVKSFPNKHLFQTAPIYVVEIPDSIDVHQQTVSYTVSLGSSHEQAVARLYGASREMRVTALMGGHVDRKDILNIVSVDIFHPLFKEQHLEMSRSPAVCTTGNTALEHSGLKL